MSHDFIIGGVVLSPLVPQLVVALLLTALLSVGLMRLGFYRLVWQRPIVELAIFCMVLGSLAAFVPDGRPMVWHSGDTP